MRTLCLTGCVLVIGALGLACDQKPAPAAAESAGARSAAAALPAGLFLASAPGGAKEVKDAKASANPGAAITLTGRIGGSVDPFVDGRAIFTIVDPRVKSCADFGAPDHCKTPWDYCCEPRDELTENMATVRVVGADGQPLKIGLRDVQGLAPLARVIVQGTVAQAEAGSLVVTAAGIHVVK